MGDSLSYLDNLLPSNIFRNPRVLEIGVYHSDIPQFYLRHIQPPDPLKTFAWKFSNIDFFLKLLHVPL